MTEVPSLFNGDLLRYSYSKEMKGVWQAYRQYQKLSHFCCWNVSDDM